MTVALVHGNPETSAIWDPLVEQLVALGHPEPLRLSPPGFGAPVPDGWGATVEEYRGWLVDELEAIDGPVDLVGHDWGGGHAVNVAMTRPDLLRSWCSDAAGLFDPEYVWHDLAQIWQRPGAGETWVEDALAAPPETLADTLVGLGMTDEIARRVASAFDETMGRCILPLYRSAAQPRMRELGAGLETARTRPGLAILATADTTVGTDEQRRRSAARAGADIAALDGLTHCWMIQAPRQSAAILAGFWASRA